MTRGRRPLFLAVSTVVAIVLSACTAAPEPTETPAPRGVDVQAIGAEWAAYADAAADAWEVPAVAMAIVTADGLAWSHGVGVNAAGGPVTDATLFEIGSATKAFLGVTQAILVDRGELDWRDRVIEHAPDFRLHDPWVTQEFRIVDLLAQRSGLPPYAADLAGALGFDDDAAIAALAHVEPVTSFRDEFAYQNVPHLVAGRIVAEKIGAPTWADAVDELVFTPLGMTASAATPDALHAAPDTTLGHQRIDGEQRALQPARFPAGVAGAGAIVSNLDDMAQWVRMHLNAGRTEVGRLVSEQNLNETYRPRVPVEGPFAHGMKQGEGEPSIGYATGWLVHSLPEGRVIEHGGTTYGYTSAVRFDPDRGVGVIVLTNLAHRGGLATPLAQYAIDLIQGREPLDYVAAIDAQVAQMNEPESEGAGGSRLPLAAYAGAYRHPVLGTVDVRADGDALRYTIGPRGVEVTLRPTGGDVFEQRWHFDADPAAAILTATVTFEGDGDRPERMLVEDLVFTAAD